MYIYIYRYAHNCIYIYICTYTYMYIYIYTYLYVYLYVYIYTYIHMIILIIYIQLYVHICYTLYFFSLFYIGHMPILSRALPCFYRQCFKRSIPLTGPVSALGTSTSRGRVRKQNPSISGAPTNCSKRSDVGSDHLGTWPWQSVFFCVLLTIPI